MTAVVMASTNVNFDPVLSKLVTSLSEADNLSTEKEIGFLKNLLESKELNALVNVHSKVVKIGKDDRLAPLLSSSMQVTLEVLEQLAPRCHISPLCKEIFYLLQTPHLQSLLCAHDAIAQKDFYPHLPDIPMEMDEDEETIKIVQLVKNNEPLGATIKNDEITGKIVIARIIYGGAADRSGLIHVGDEVIEVNGTNVETRTPDEVLSLLRSSEGTINFKIVPSDHKNVARESKLRVRAHFDYNPDTDPYIPCKAAGLSFSRGDILHVVVQDEVHWWQARKENVRICTAGLIPSKVLQERRIIHERTQKHANTDNCNIKKDSFCSANCATGAPGSPNPNNICHGPKTKKIMYDLDENDDFDREMIATYEDVVKLYPIPKFFRPIVLIGAPGVGRNELKRRLSARDPEKYRSPVPYTTRPIRPGEVAGREYIFVSYDKMQLDITNGKFIEHGEYKGHLYGTSGESVRSIVHAGCVCLLSPHYQAIKFLRTPELKPYIIHIRTPTFERLKETRIQARARSTFDETNSRGFTDEEFLEMIHSDERINFLYGHFFDEEIVNEDLANAFENLVISAERAETEPLWVPASWVQ